MMDFVTMTLYAALLIVTAACAEIKINESETFRILSFRNANALCEEAFGGWINAEGLCLNNDLRAIFEQALEGTAGVDCAPVACLGARVAAGTDYCFLAQATATDADAAPRFVLAFVRQDASGGVTLQNVADLAVVPNENGTAEPIPTDGIQPGGWAFAKSYALTDGIRARFDAALNTLLGATYEPIANLAEQTDRETNRCILCRVTPAVPNAVSHYALVYIREDSEGGAVLQGAIDLDYGALCAEAA